MVPCAHVFICTCTCVASVCTHMCLCMCSIVYMRTCSLGCASGQLVGRVGHGAAGLCQSPRQRQREVGAHQGREATRSFPRETEGM